MHWLLLVGISTTLAASELTFNRDIRPILSDQCFHCHGPDPNNRKAGLRLDDEQAARAALKNGHRAIVPGDAASSEIVKRIRHTSKALRMPPAYAGRDALPEKDIEKLERWIAQGAKYESHWAFLAPVKRPAPQVLNSSWVKNDIDAHILAKLEQKSWDPTKEADRATLLRRLSFDLTGLPPTPAELDSFERDQRPDAYERQVDRLLASPRYAERMAWRWLEAARYADTNGYQSDGVRDMYRWRDYVLESFASNKPFDRFILEQLAGDLLPNATLEQRIATAFHRNNRTSAEGGIVPEEFRVEYVADRAETTATVFLGLTMGCARCHDHKYDPIPQKDFYRMFAFFNRLPEKGLVYNWGNDEPLIKAPTPPQAAQLARLDAQVSDAQSAVQKLEARRVKDQRKWLQQTTAKKLEWYPGEGLAYQHQATEAFDGKRVVEEKPGTVVYDYLSPFTFSAWVKPAKADGAILSIAEDYDEGNGHALLMKQGKLRLHVVFRWTDIGLRVETEQPLPLNAWSHVVATYDGSRYAKGVKLFVNGQPQAMKILFDELNWPMKFKYPLKIGAGYGLRFEGAIEDVRVYTKGLSEAEVNALHDRAPLSPASHPDKIRLAHLQHANYPEHAALRDAKARRDAYYATLPTVMVMEDGPPRQAFVLKRGAYDAHGEPVEPGTPTVLPPMRRDLPNNRLGLAQWIFSRENPLTARVTVNRFWQMIFGTGLVKTVEDFGSQGELPIHQELLDSLAVDFMESGWDTKALLRKIVTSAMYRQSAKAPAEMYQLDPENRYYARATRMRLSPEMIRDQALAVSGLLVEKVGGPSVKPYQPDGLWKELASSGDYPQDHGANLYRRSVYTFWKRTVAPPAMVNFDSPNREVCTVRESRTNTPLQALNLMNDVTYLEAARKLGERLMREGGIVQGTRMVLGRNPTAKEQTLLTAALDRFRARFAQDPKAADAMLDQGEAPLPRKANRRELAAWMSLASMLFNLDEAITRQ
jgi:hypothetical protein